MLNPRTVQTKFIHGMQSHICVDKKEPQDYIPQKISRLSDPRRIVGQITLSLGKNKTNASWVQGTSLQTCGKRRTRVEKSRYIQESSDLSILDPTSTGET